MLFCKEIKGPEILFPILFHFGKSWRHSIKPLAGAVEMNSTNRLLQWRLEVLSSTLDCTVCFSKEIEAKLSDL